METLPEKKTGSYKNCYCDGMCNKCNNFRILYIL